MAQSDLQTAISNIEAELATLMTLAVAEGPSYSIDGQSVDKLSYMRWITERKKILTETLGELSKVMNARYPYIVGTVHRL